MSTIKYTLWTSKIAVLPTKKGILKVGNVIEYTENDNGSINITLDIDKSLPKDIIEAIEKNPKCLSIQSNITDSTNITVY